MIAVTGGKGGCGKTTTALGVARALTQRGHEPLVVDTDTDMPDLHHLADMSREPSSDQLASGEPLSTAVRRSEQFPGVYFLTAGGRDSQRQALNLAKTWSGPVLLDCPPGLGPGVIGPQRAATAALVVTTDQPTCLEDTTQTIRTLRQVETTPLGVIGIRRSNQRPPPAVAGCRVLATPPYTRTPFQNEHVSRAWQRVAKKVQLSDQKTTDRRTESVTRTEIKPEPRP